MDPITELAELQAKLTRTVTEVKASGRVLSDTEIAALEKDRDRAIELKGIVASQSRGTALLHSLEGDVASGDSPADPGNSGSAKGYLTPDSFKSMARAATPEMAKALVAGGSAVTPVALTESPLRLGVPSANLGILAAIPVVKRNTKKYSYLRQTVRTSNAAVVAPGAQKPTSIFTVESVENELEVIAHLSEYVDSYLLRDNSNLEGFLGEELQNGIFQKVTADAVAELSGTAGIQTQAFTTNIMDSIYLGTSKSAGLGYNPDVVLMSRADYDALALAKDADGNYLYRRDEDSRLHGLYPVIATGLPAKSAIVLDSSKVSISTDTLGLLGKVDDKTRLDYNEVRFLLEGRFATDVLAPASVVKVGTAA